jgi:hypothetical protein
MLFFDSDADIVREEGMGESYPSPHQHFACLKICCAHEFDPSVYFVYSSQIIEVNGL